MTERETLERSREEEAELKRSTKKVKETHPPRTPSFGDGSFKDKLLGDIPGAYAQAFSFNPQDEEEPMSDGEMEELNSGIAAVHFSCEDKASIRGRWAFALIIKTFGRNVGFHYLQTKILSLWKPAGRLECIDLEYGFYLVRFSLVEYYDKVLREGPWFIGGQFLSIRAWEPNFKPSSAVCSTVAAWVRLPKLPVEYYEQRALKEIGQAVGPVLRIDTHTASESYGWFARICVQINLDKPLIKTIMIGRFAQPVIYEGINTLCFDCGRVGHAKGSCPYTIRVTAPPVGPEMVTEEPTVSQVSHTPPASSIDGSSDTYGPWTLVAKRKNRSAKPKNPTKHKTHIPIKAKGNVKPLSSPQSPLSGPRDGKRKSTLGQNNIPSSPKALNTSPLTRLDSLVSGNSAPKQPQTHIHTTTPNAFSFGASHYPTLPSDPNTNLPLKLPPKTSGNHGKFGHNSKLKGKGKANCEPRSPGVGDLLQGKDHCTLESNNRRDQSKPNPHHGLLRDGTDGSLESHLPSYCREQEVRMSASHGPSLVQLAQPLVELLDRPTIKEGESDSIK